MKSRIGSINRKTKETQVSITVNLDGNGKISVQTGINFLDHLITSLGKHSMLDLKLNAVSKDGIAHHLIQSLAVAGVPLLVGAEEINHLLRRGKRAYAFDLARPALNYA